MNTRVTSLAAVMISLILGLFASSNPVHAHADYDTSTPSRGEQLTAAPTSVEIVFTQELQKLAGSYSITVNQDRGPEVTSGPAVINDSDRFRMSVELLPNLPDGRYVVNWTNLSDGDGDRNRGAFSFYVNHVPTEVDLANDAALEAIGPDEATPAATPTSSAGEETVVLTATPEPVLSPTAISTPEGGEQDDGSDSNGLLIAVVGVVAVVGVLGGAAFIYVRNG